MDLLPVASREERPFAARGGAGRLLSRGWIVSSRGLGMRRRRDYTEFPDVKRVFLPLVQPNVAWMDYGIRIRHVVDDHSPLQEVLAYFSKFGRLPNAFHILVTVSGVHAPTGTPVTSCAPPRPAQIPARLEAIGSGSSRAPPDGLHSLGSIASPFVFGRLCRQLFRTLMFRIIRKPSKRWPSTRRLVLGMLASIAASRPHH